MSGAGAPNCAIGIGWLGISFACTSNYIVNIGWLDVSSANDSNNVISLGSSISVSKIV